MQDIAFTPPSDWTDAYTNGAYIPGADGYPERWAAAAALFRQQMTAAGRFEVDISYGAGERHRFDLVRPAGAPRGLAVFVHGGYWMRFDKSFWTHFAVAAVDLGFAVVLPSYELCPQVRVSDITRQIASAIEVAAGLVPGPICLAGHSAGGQIVSRIRCGDVGLSQATDARVMSTLSISGLHDLRPLVQTAMNATLKIDAAEARRESPALLQPGGTSPVTAWVGGAERPEFLRQAALLGYVWGGFVPIRTVVDPELHHFNVLDGLLIAGHPLVTAWLGLKR